MKSILQKIIFLLLATKTISTMEQTILIPHSHDDLGWNWTIEEYYVDKVSKILDTVITSLEKNSERKFVYSEVGFLKIWINRQPEKREEKLQRVNNLIKKNQFEFINGGMSQADSAAPFYEDIMENWYYGLNYLKKNFNSNSKSAWQIDPFGHSKCLSFIARLFGMKEIVVNRIGDVKKDNLAKNKNFTLNWKFHDDSVIRTHVTSNHYSTPYGMHCDADCDINKSFSKVDLDNFLEIYNKKYTYAPWYFFGDDFNFTNAENNFSFIDQVLAFYPDFNYGLFSDYINLVNKQQKENPKILLNFTEDFFVYEEGNGDSWSGYYTTKQRMKKRIRKLGKMLRSFKNIAIRKNAKTGSISKIDDYLDISENFGIFLHHDCITGTAKRYVDDDYYRLMSELEQRMMTNINELYDTNLFFCLDNENLFGLENCEFKQKLGNDFFLNVYNSSPVEISRIIKFVFDKNDYEVINMNRDKFEVDTITCSGNKCEYFFVDTLKSFGFNKYKISVKNSNKITYDENNEEEKLLNFEDIHQDDFITLKSKGDYTFTNNIYLYSIDSQSSGAYILKYDGKINMKNIKIPKNRSIKRVGNIQILKYYNKDWSLTIINDIHTETVYEVKVQIDNINIFNKGIDLVLKIENKNIENTYFETDSNGLFKMKRENGIKWETSVYPFTSDVTIKDEKSTLVTKVLTKSSQGVINPAKGELLIYLERTTSQDDDKGVDEKVELNNSFITSNYVINANSEERMNELFYDLKFVMDNELLIMYSKNNEILLENDNSDLAVGNEFRFNVDFVDEKSFLVRVQNVRRDISVSFDMEVLKSVYGDFEFKMTSYENIFYNGSEVFGSESNIDIKPMEFKLFQVDL